MKLKRSIVTIIILTGLFSGSCVKKLDLEPIDPRSFNSAVVFDNPKAYKQFLAKLYASLSLTGQRGEFGAPEIIAGDEGTTAFLRGYWSAQEVPTDECINAWGDPGLSEYHSQIWGSQNTYVKLMYQRLFVNIAFCNEYISTVDKNMGSLDGTLKDEVIRYRAEARFLRAYFYLCAMDLFGNVPFVTYKEAIPDLPSQISRKDLFAHIEGELIDILPALAAPGANEYARADRAAAWALLSRLYLNAQVYTGMERNSDCIIYSDKVISSNNYSLHNNYQELFLADNHRWRQEIIMPIASDGLNSRSYGDMTFVIHAAIGGNSQSAVASSLFGVGGGWGGNRMTSSFVNSKFPDPSGATDKRAIFYTDGQNLTITDPNTFGQGYLSAKYKNRTSKNVAGRHDVFVDTDFPLIRLGEIYLNYAEAAKRGGAGDAAKALLLINKLRTRAYGNMSGNITASQLDLNFLLDERGRELYWEAHRRTDLVRFGKFTGSGLLWDFKGGVMAGAATAEHKNLFPIPLSDLLINTNLSQNQGY